MGILLEVKSSPVNIVIYLIVLCFLTSCTEPSEEPLRISSSPWPGYEPLYLARDLNYLPSDKVHIFELPSSDINMESFRNRSTDVSTLTLDETLELLHDGIMLRILLIMDISNGGDAVLAKPEIKNMGDIKGKRISIVNITLGLYMLNRFLDHAGLERNDVEVFPMPESNQEYFFLQGDADVVITFEPVKSRLLKHGMHVIFDSSEIPNEIFDLLVVHEDVYKKRKDDLCFVAQQWFKTLNYIKQNKLDAAERITRRLHLNTDQFDILMTGMVLPDRKQNIELLGGSNPGLISPAKRLVEIMRNEKQLLRQVDVKNAIDPEFARCFNQ